MRRIFCLLLALCLLAYCIPARAEGPDLGPLSIGGRYVPGQNLFSLGAPALCEAMCDFTSRATLLGTLGSHIGHELSHGYDFIGAQYNSAKSGPLFTEADTAVFTEKAMAIADRLSQIESGNGNRAAGRQTHHGGNGGSDRGKPDVGSGQNGRKL